MSEFTYLKKLRKFHEMLKTSGHSMKQQLKEIAFSSYKRKFNNIID
jgi:hypothetical protein